MSIEHFLQIKFLQILQNNEQFIHILFLHEAILHFIRQSVEHIFELQIEQNVVDFFVAQIEHFLFLFN